MRVIILIVLTLLPARPALADQNCAIELFVLGISQDAGTPQMGNPDDPAWTDPSLKRYAASLALIDYRFGERFLFEATPDMREQLQMLDSHAPSARSAPGLAGIFLTHAHIGHYTGLMFLGHESMGAREVPVYAMPRMGEYLSGNGPWDQLIRYKNISLQPLFDKEPTQIAEKISVIPYLVPHRDEYSETVGFLIETAGKNAFFLPDIDDWDRWESEYGILIEDMIARVDIAYLDATFFDNNEIPGRDMSGFPHPRIRESMDRFSELPEQEQKKIRFIHLNHTNPARFPGSPQSQEISRRGFKVAEEGETFCLVNF